MNIDKYLNNLTEGQECMIFKVEDFDLATDNEIIYIGEFGIRDLSELKEQGQDLTDEEMIDKGIASSKMSIREELITHGGFAEDEIDRKNLVNLVFELLNWAYSCTIVNEAGDLFEQ